MSLALTMAAEEVAKISWAFAIVVPVAAVLFRSPSGRVAEADAGWVAAKACAGAVVSGVGSQVAWHTVAARLAVIAVSVVLGATDTVEVATVQDFAAEIAVHSLTQALKSLGFFLCICNRRGSVEVPLSLLIWDEGLWFVLD